MDLPASMQIGLDDIAAWHQQQAGNSSSTQEQQQQQQQSKQAAASPADDSSEASSSDDGPRDWKGEPMKLNPGRWPHASSSVLITSWVWRVRGSSIS
jgi:hypothetical protein